MEEGVGFWIQQKDVRKFLCGFLNSLDLSLFDYLYDNDKLKLDTPIAINWAFCTRVAREGHLKILQWARSDKQMFPYDKHTCASAARGGHLNVLKWARSNGAPWDNHVLIFAEAFEFTEMLNWALANGCRWSPN
jgi:hypothetical protein